MIQILHGTNVPFMKWRKIAYTFSSLLLVAGLVSLVVKGGPRLGVDFSGGTLLDLRFSQPVHADVLRSASGKAGLDNVEIQAVEGSNEAILRVPQALTPTRNEQGQLQSGPAVRLQENLRSTIPGITVEVRRQEVVGPKVGRELTLNAIKAILFSLVGILIYVSLRFHRWEFGAGGAIALAHDILITLGLFSIMNKEFTLTVLAAFLTIAGYSINDTIVVFDRMRENLGFKKKTSLSDLMDMSINQTLSRTILTVATVMFTVVALFFLGGKVIHDFALAMLIGVGFGTYSSVFVASALALDIDTMRQKRMLARAAQVKAQREEKSRSKGKNRGAA